MRITIHCMSNMDKRNSAINSWPDMVEALFSASFVHVSCVTCKEHESCRSSRAKGGFPNSDPYLIRQPV